MKGRNPINEEFLIFLSDSHFTAHGEPWDTGVTPSDGPAHAHEFRLFLEHLTARRPEDRPQSVVLLGDWLDFADIAERANVRGIWEGIDGDSRASETLQWITQANRAVFEGLRECLCAGISVEVVLGNHDMDLARQVIQKQLQDLLSPRVRGTATLNFHPWLFHKQGLVYAEHGHQFQAINHFPMMLQPHGSDRCQQTYRTLATVLGEHRHRRRYANGDGWFGPVREDGWFLYQVCAGIVDQVNPRRRREIADYQQRDLPRYAEALGLDPQAVLDIDTISRFRVSALIRAVLRQAGNRHLGTSADYLVAACQKIDEVLRSVGCSVPFYIFGHSHRASRRPVERSGVTSLYLNTGTWSPYVRGPHAAEGRVRTELTYVAVRQSAGASSAALCRWPQGTRRDRKSEID